MATSRAPRGLGGGGASPSCATATEAVDDQPNARTTRQPTATRRSERKAEPPADRRTTALGESCLVPTAGANRQASARPNDDVAEHAQTEPVPSREVRQLDHGRELEPVDERQVDLRLGRDPELLNALEGEGQPRTVEIADVHRARPPEREPLVVLSLIHI